MCPLVLCVLLNKHQRKTEHPGKINLNESRSLQRWVWPWRSQLYYYMQSVLKGSQRSLRLVLCKHTWTFLLQPTRSPSVARQAIKPSPGMFANIKQTLSTGCKTICAMRSLTRKNIHSHGIKKCIKTKSSRNIQHKEQDEGQNTGVLVRGYKSLI